MLQKGGGLLIRFLYSLAMNATGDPSSELLLFPSEVQIAYKCQQITLKLHNLVRRRSAAYHASTTSSSTPSIVAAASL